MARIVLIGPVRPYRGGIAHSTTILSEKLAKGNDLLVLSFSRMFPKILYPGRFQREKGPSPKGFKTEFTLDSINPLSWARAVKRIKEFKADVVIFEWWTTFLTPCYRYIARRVKPQSKVSVICQNVLPHEKISVHSFLSKLFLGQAGSFVTLAKSDEKLLKKLIPGAKAKTIIEPTYDSLVGLKKATKSSAKKKLGIRQGKALLFFGFVRPYKGLEYLLKAMPAILEKNDCRLMVVGEFWEPKEKYSVLIEELGISEKIRIVDKYVSDKSVPLYFGACDAVVLPYTSSTESGIIQLAFGYNTPIITTRTGGNPDLIEDGKSGLLVRPRSAKELAEAVNLFYSKKLEGRFRKEMQKKKKIFRWNKEKENAVLGKF